MYQVSTPTAVLRGHRRLLSRGAVGHPRPPHRRAARAHEPAHRHLVGDGRDRAAALPRLRRRLLAARLRRHRRPLQRRDGDRPARERLHRRPLAAPQGGRGVRLRALGDLQAAAGRRRHRGVRDRRGRAARPRRQGDPHRAARRDDLAVARRRSSSAPRSASIARWTPSARCSARSSRSRCSRSRRWPSTRSSSSRSASRMLGLGILLLLVNGSATARPARRSRSARRRCAGRSRSSRIAALPRAADRRRRAEPRHGERRVRVPRPAGEARPRDVPVPAAVRRQRGHVHGPRRADGPARGPHRPRPRAVLAATRCCSRSTRPAAGAGRRLAARWPLVLGLLGALLRRHRRRADGARQRRRARTRSAAAASRCSARRRASRGWSRRSRSARSGRSGASTSRSPASASRSSARPSLAARRARAIAGAGVSSAPAPHRLRRAGRRSAWPGSPSRSSPGCAPGRGPTAASRRRPQRAAPTPPRAASPS